MTKYESQIYTIDNPQFVAYHRLSDLRYFEALKQAFANPEMLERIKGQIPAEHATPEKLQGLREQVEKMEFTEDSISIDSPAGRITLCIVEREEPKLLKFATEGSPFKGNLWVQLLPKGESQSALKVTLGADLNFCVRKMIEKHLKQAPDGIGSFLSQLLSAR